MATGIAYGSAEIFGPEWASCAAALVPPSSAAENIARAMSEYQDAGVETFILSGYPHLEEAYRTAELLFPAIGKNSPIFQTVEKALETVSAHAGSTTIGRFSSI